MQSEFDCELTQRLYKVSSASAQKNENERIVSLSLKMPSDHITITYSETTLLKSVRRLSKFLQ